MIPGSGPKLVHRLARPFTALLLFGAVGILAMVLVFATRGPARTSTMPRSSPAAVPSTPAPAAQFDTATPAAESPPPEPATPDLTTPSTSAPIVVPGKHHRRESD